MLTWLVYSVAREGRWSERLHHVLVFLFFEDESGTHPPEHVRLHVEETLKHIQALGGGRGGGGKEARSIAQRSSIVKVIGRRRKGKEPTDGRDLDRGKDRKGKERPSKAESEERNKRERKQNPRMKGHLPPPPSPDFTRARRLPSP